MVNKEKISQIKNANERKFAENFFDHDQWISQPRDFELGGYKYRPDFYDKKRDVYIEVSASRQAYYANKAKYLKFMEVYGKDKLEVLSVDGDVFPAHRDETLLFPVYDIIGTYHRTEDALISVFRKLKEKYNMTVEGIADEAFPEHHDKCKKVELILNGSLKVGFCDFLCLCHAFKLEPQDVIVYLSRWRGASFLYNETPRSTHNKLGDENEVSVEVKVAKYENIHEYRKRREI